jgi:hypothetical protein
MELSIEKDTMGRIIVETRLRDREWIDIVRPDKGNGFMLERRWICLGFLFCAACVSLPASGEFSFALGPYLKFLTPHSAAIAWQTEKPATAVIEIRQNGSVFAVERIESLPIAPGDSPQSGAEGKYIYQIALHCGGVAVQSPTYEIDNSLNFTKYPLAEFLRRSRTKKRKDAASSSRVPSFRKPGLPKAIVSSTDAWMAAWRTSWPNKAN